MIIMIVKLKYIEYMNIYFKNIDRYVFFLCYIYRIIVKKINVGRFKINLFFIIEEYYKFILWI